MSLEGMKVLEIGPIFFKLPEGFTGSLADAIRVLADYHESVKTEDREHCAPEEQPDPYEVERKKRWSGFLLAVKRGKRVHGRMSVSRVTSGKAILEEL